MGLNDLVVAALRRAAVAAVAFALTWLAIHLKIGLDANTSTALTALVTAVLVAAWGWVAQMLEQRYPWLGRILFLGASRKVTYSKHRS